MGVEPTIFRLEVERVIHCATRVLNIFSMRLLQDSNLLLIRLKSDCFTKKLNKHLSYRQYPLKTGVEPVTSRLTVVRPNQLSYSSNFRAPFPCSLSVLPFRAPFPCSLSVLPKCSIWGLNP